MDGKAGFVKEKRNENTKKYILWGVLTLFGGVGVCYLLNMAGFAGQENLQGFTQSALAPLSFVLVGYFLRGLNKDYQGLTKEKQKRRFWFSLSFSFLLSLSFLLGYQMRLLGNTLPGIKGKILILFMSGGLAVALLPLINLWFVLLEKWQEKTKEEAGACGKEMVSGRKTFLLSWLVIFVCWIPVFLAYYPAIMSYDFHRQSQEAYVGFEWFNDHHPLLHTLLIRIFFLLGEAIGSYEVGMAVFSVFQMAILSGVLAYSCNVVGRMTGKSWPVKGMVLLYGLLPIHPVLALSTTKDILFTAFFILLVLLLWEQQRFWKNCYTGSGKDKRKLVLLWIATVLSGVLAMLFRNNAVYAFAIFAIFYIAFWGKGQRIYIGLLCLAIVAGGIGGRTGLRVAMDAGQGSQMEMYSVFVQQMGRVGQRHGDKLTEEEWGLIDYYVPDETWDDYNPPLSDTIKAYITVTSYQSWKDDIPGMLRDWMKIGLRYPNEYLDAFLALTGGYWFLDDVSHAEVLGYGEDSNLGLLYTFNASESDVFPGIESKSYFPALLSLYAKILNGNCYYGWPVLSLLFKPAFYTWLMVLALFSYLYLKKPKRMYLSILTALYLLTLFLGPVVNMRYAYPVMVTIPVLLAYLFAEE